MREAQNPRETEERKTHNPPNKTLEVLVISIRGSVFGFCFAFLGFLEVFVCLLVFSRFESHVLFQSTWEWCTGACCSEFFRYFANARPMAGPSATKRVPAVSLTADSRISIVMMSTSCPTKKNNSTRSMYLEKGQERSCKSSCVPCWRVGRQLPQRSGGTWHRRGHPQWQRLRTRPSLRFRQYIGPSCSSLEPC